LARFPQWDLTDPAALYYLALSLLSFAALLSHLEGKLSRH
jgi:hypothetical protein